MAIQLHNFLNSLTIGDKLFRNKGFFVAHVGIYMGYWKGQHLIAENNTPYGVRYVSYADFLADGEFLRVEKSYLNQWQQNDLIDFVNSRIGMPYNLLNYNCESFANHALVGEAHSPQIRKAVAFTAVIGILSLILNTK